MPGKKQKNKKTKGKVSQTKFLYMVAIMIIMAGTATAYSRQFIKQVTPVVLGEEDSGDSVEADDEEKAEVGENDDEDQDEEKDVEADDEEDSEDAEVEEAKRVRTTADRMTPRRAEAEDDEESDKVDSDKIENEDGEENDVQEKIQELGSKINRTEARLNALSINGLSLTVFATTIADAKSLLAEAQAKVATDAATAEQITELAEKKLERVSKMIKLLMGDAEDEDGDKENNDNNDANEALAKLTKEIGKVDAKLAALAAAGMDVAAQKASLETIRMAMAQSQAQISSGDLAGGEVAAKVALKKLNVLKDSIEEAFENEPEGDDEEDDIAKTYKNSVAQFVHNLNAVSELEGGIGQQVRQVAQAQNEAQPKVEKAVSRIERRGKFTKFLIGPDFGSINEVTAAITENQGRINSLKAAMDAVADPAVKLILQDQITTFEKQNQKLQKFTTKSSEGISLFGWVARLFS